MKYCCEILFLRIELSVMKFHTLSRFCFTLALVVICFTSQNFALAQNEYEILDELGTTQSANLFVDAISPNSREYSTGEVISGTFKLFNVGKATADKVRFRTHIISTEQSDVDYFPRNILFSGPISEEFSLDQGSVEKRFTITVPAAIPAETTFAIYIEAYINDEVVTYEYKPTIIEGNTIDFISYRGALHIGDETFSFLEGPTVLDGEVLDLRLTITGGKKAKTLTPVITIFKGPSTDTKIDTISFDSFLVGIDEDKTQSFVLPVSYGPGVYTGSLVFLDEQSDVVSTQLISRYVLDGLKPNIHTVSFNDLDQKKIQSFIVSLEYADAPVSARINSDGDFIDPRAAAIFVKEGEEPFVAQQYDILDSVSATVVITDAVTGKLLQTLTVSGSELNPITFNFEPIKNVGRVVVAADLFINDEKVDEYITTVAITQEYESVQKNMMFTYIFLIGLVVLIIFAITIVTLRTINGTKEKKYEK